MDVVFWIVSALTLLAVLAYAAIGAALLMAKYRRANARAAERTITASAGIVDLRYRTP